MRPTPCPRLFEAEALCDGRLSGAGRASFERHTSQCAACAREIEAIEHLYGSLRALPDHGVIADELRGRRERTRLLRAFEHSLVEREPPYPAIRRLLWAAAAGLVLVAVVVVSLRAKPVQRSTPTSSDIIRAEGTAAWSKRTEGHRERVLLAQGTLFIRVTHGVDKGPLLVVLPDGELEDTGTVFRVSAEAGHTMRVAVEEGSVVLRLRGVPPVVLGAGQTWLRPAEPNPVTSETVQDAPSSIAARPARDPSAEFRAAMAALDGGDNRSAATWFGRYLETHPRDPRAEDAAYLRVIALQRCGDERRMMAAAAVYLRRFPAGFRRAELERLAKGL
jgi:hypothetical protein